MSDKNKTVKDFSVGEKALLYICPMYYRDKEITKETIITSIGKKYVTVDYDKKVKFEESDWLEFGLVEKCDTSPRYYLFKDINDYKDWKEKNRLKSYLREAFSNGSWLSLATLRKIENVIMED